VLCRVLRFADFAIGRLDMAFIVDSSSSIAFNDRTMWNAMCKFIANLTDKFEIGPNATQIAIVTFSNRSSVMVRFSRHQLKTPLLLFIRNMPYRGGLSNLNDALYKTWSDVFAVGGGSRTAADKVAIILTDGVDNVPGMKSPVTIQNARRCKQDGIRLMAVGITSRSNDARLIQIVSSPDDLFHASNGIMLGELIPLLIQRITRATPTSSVTGIVTST